jgi:hypothetical protein
MRSRRRAALPRPRFTERSRPDADVEIFEKADLVGGTQVDCFGVLELRTLSMFAAVVTASLLSACTATAPKSQQVSQDALLVRKEGVLLLVDVCVQRDGLGKGDYFVVNEAEAGARAALDALRKYIHASDIAVRAEITAVCAARINKSHSPIAVADSVGGQRRLAAQPLRVSGANAQDSQYQQALGVLSSYAFERAAVDSAKKTDAKKSAQNSAATVSDDSAIRGNEFRIAAAVLKERTQASSVLFLGELGTSRSAGKAAAQIIGGMLVGFGSAIATAGLGTGYYLIFTPGHQIDGVVMEGALIDLDSGVLTWSHAVHALGDPVNPKALADQAALDLLFHEVLFKPVLAPSPGTAKP